jgi:hypothetical protein
MSFEWASGHAAIVVGGVEFAKDSGFEPSRRALFCAFTLIVDCACVSKTQIKTVASSVLLEVPLRQNARRLFSS